MGCGDEASAHADPSDLDGPAAELLALLREGSSPHAQDRAAPRPWRELACMFELEDEVRNGGFSQYFFNHTCANAFDAWAATAPSPIRRTRSSAAR